MAGNKRKYSDSEDNVNNSKKRKQDQQTYKWDILEQYIPPDNWNEVHTIGLTDWVSATKIKNFLLRDPLLDYLDLSNKRAIASIQLSGKVNNKKLEKIQFSKGNEFEKRIMNELQEKYRENYVQISNCVEDILNKENAELTIKHMVNGTPIISQAVLYNYSNKTFGCADLLIRSDWVNKLFKEPQLTKEEENISTTKLNHKYHYRVIDIKWSTLKLCADGEHIMNYDLMLAYKGQLAIYNCAIGYIQGYTPNKAYIMGKTWKYTTKGTEYKGYDYLDLLGHIDYQSDKYDNDYIMLTYQAIKWIRTVRYNWGKWSLYPKPTVPELYPNMNNSYDDPYSKAKKEYAEYIGEMTMITGVSYKNRLIANKNNIYSWKDENCSAKTMGLNGKILAPLVDQIIQINKSETDLIRPQYITKHKNVFEQAEKSLNFYIDFETISSCFMEDEIDIHDSNTNGTIIFMIGIGYVDEYGMWQYKCFKQEKYCHQEERKILHEFNEFVREIIYKYTDGINQSGRPVQFFHWSQAEPVCLESANGRHHNILATLLANIEWIDLYEIFRSEPILVNGAFTFSLKNIANAMHKNGMIHTKWNSTISDGLQAMYDAVNYYKKDVTSPQVMENIVNYNEVDCKVMYEIVSYLQKNHIK